jgi:ribosomal protein S18 acetylase RimI-like enzyme
MTRATLASGVRLIDVVPPVDAFIALRVVCGWGEISREAAIPALESSVDAVTALDENGDVVGFVRAIGDPMYLYIQDAIIAPTLRGQGLGRLMMERLLARLKPAYPEATIMLMCAKGRERFYEQLGFESRPSESYGPGMQMLSDPDSPKS